MIKIAVCDDEIPMQNDLQRRIRQQETECEITCFSSGRELSSNRTAFDLVFLDIGMEGQNGIETAKALRKQSKAVLIFVTALKEHVFDAFDVGAFHYLLKPLNDEKFKEVLNKALDEIGYSKNREPLMIKFGSTRCYVPIEDIYYAENSGRKIILHTKDKQLEFYGKMQDLQQRLGSGFFRCHRGFLVHLSEISGYDNTNIFLKSKDRIFLAKTKYNEFVSAYMAYLKKMG